MGWSAKCTESCSVINVLPQEYVIMWNVSFVEFLLTVYDCGVSVLLVR